LGDLDKAIELGYEADGETYYYKFHCLYNLDDKEGALETLKYAVGLYPNNNDIIEGLLQLYSTGDEDPTNLIPMVLKAIEQNPTNAGLQLGLASVYDKLGQVDNSIEAAKKAAALSPGDFYANYFDGFFTIKKGDAMDAELRTMTITSNNQYQEALNEVNAVYAKAIAPLERAYEIDKSEIATVELLKNLTFRLREQDGINVKFEKYDALYKSMNANSQ
jgi:tetratricopeptide (TPR) repeat protein